MNVRAPMPYPLVWPPGWPRTESTRRERSKFKATIASAIRFLQDEVRRLGGKNLVVSSNCTMTDGRPADPGVCAFFHYKGIDTAIPCDRWRTPEENIHAVAKTIESMRGIERWGAAHMLKAAFTGFAALMPPDDARPWRDALGFAHDARVESRADVDRQFRVLAATHHPDKGGDPARFREISEARAAAYNEIRA